MSNQKNGNAKENVIQGPWPKSKRKVKVPDEEILKLQEHAAFAEELNQNIIVQMVQTMGENDIDVTDESFIRDLGLIIELTKGSIYRSMGIPHPTHAFFEAIVDITIDDDKNIYSQIDLNMLEKFVEVSKYLEDDDDEDDDPEIS